MPYLINSLKIDYFRNQIFQLASGCAQPNISAEQINNISLLYPSTKILSEYNMKCKWMYEQIANCRYQIDVLTKQRDELLPLLMNGQASVNYHLSAKVYPLPTAYNKAMPMVTNKSPLENVHDFRKSPLENVHDFRKSPLENVHDFRKSPLENVRGSEDIL